MSSHPVKGKTIHFVFRDGHMAGKTVAHSFHQDGSLDFDMLDESGASSGKKVHVDKYEVAKVRDEVYAVAYLGGSGYTLTTVVDFEAKTLVAFSSNEKELGLQHGKIELPG